MSNEKRSENIIITVKAQDRTGDRWAEFVAGEVAKALGNLEAFGVATFGEFNNTNDTTERAHRFKQLVAASRERVTILVQPEST